MGSLIIKKCIVGTLALGLAGSGTNKNSSLKLEFLKYRPLDDARSIAFLMIRLHCSMELCRNLLGEWWKAHGGD